MDIWDCICVSFMFSYGYLGLFSLLVVCHVHMCVVFTIWVHFRFQFIYVGGFWLFVLLVPWLFTHNEDIVTFRCGGGEPCSCTLFYVFGVVLYYLGVGVESHAIPGDKES